MYGSLAAAGEAVEEARRLARIAQTRAGVSASEESVLVQQVCAEAGIWAPDVAKRAIGQASGDTSRAVALVRVWAATLPSLEGPPATEHDIELTRRLSAAYAEIPGGQWLGASDEQASRILSWGDERDDGDTRDPWPGSHRPIGPTATMSSARCPRRSGTPRVRDLLRSVRIGAPEPQGDGPDPARTAPKFPLSGLGRLALLARSETGALVALATVAMAGRREAILAEGAEAIVGVHVSHPRTGHRCRVAEVPIVEADAVIDADTDGQMGLVLGYGVSLGSIERRAIAIALLDAALRQGPLTTALGEGSVISACDGLNSAGSVEHLRLPHYVSFAAYLDALGARQDGLAQC
jgi:alpha-D-ribose 1-methylphosphonate 5-triphosphate synthase subunit PhnI